MEESGWARVNEDDRAITIETDTLEAVIPKLVRMLHGMFIWGHPRSQINVVPNDPFSTRRRASGKSAMA